TTFDENGLLVEQVSNVGSKEEKTTLSSYDTNLRKPLRVLENGLVNYYAYDKNGQLTSSIEAVVANLAKSVTGIKELRYEYNEVGQLTKNINEKGAVSSNEYDKSGNQNKSTDELGFTSEVTKFDKAGRELEKVGINGEVSSSTYDTMGRMLSQTVNNQTTTYEYDGLGRAVKTTYPNGLIEQKSYDTVGNLLSSWDNSGNKTQNSYDERNNLIKTEIFKNDTLISKTQSEYDTKDRVIASVDAFGKKTIFEYNQLGQKISQTDANANKTRYEYDNLGRLTKEIDPMGGVSAYSFNKDGLQEKVTTPNSAIFSFGYNSLKQMTAKTSPDSGIVGLEYDISGNVIKETNAKGENKKYEYDIANRKTAVIYDDASLNERYEYDNGANAKGKLTKITDSTGSMSFEYDQNGNITTKTQTIGTQTYTSHFSYDEDGKLLSQTLPSGKNLSYAYDKNDLISISLDGKALVGNIKTDQNGLVGYDFGDGLKHSREYDLAGRVKKLSYPNYVENLSYDAVGNILAIDNQNFTYDALYRLTNYQNDGKIQAFSYDGNANRLSLISENNTTYDYKTGTNQLSKIEKIDKNSTKTTTNFLYDENGNLLKDASHEYIYDKKARLIGVDNNVSYAYNHENTRVSKTVNAQTTHFIYDGAKLIGEYNSEGSVKNEYIYLDNIPVGVIPRGYPQDGVKYIHTDHLGTPRRLADENANIVWSWESKAFGDDEAVGSVEFNLRFAGQYFDDETKTHYNINRDYNPQTGRYIQSDPIGFNGGVNSYGYVGGNPLGAVDEMGLVKLNWFLDNKDNKTMTLVIPKYAETQFCEVSTYPNLISKKIILQLEHEKDRRTKRRR
ncbi:MAG: RHS repeat protein, partial [Sulfurovum sp.]